MFVLEGEDVSTSSGFMVLKNGRYARPTSDRNFAGAIAEKDSFLLS